MLEQVRRIARASTIPVSADLEAGAIGLNFEDFEHGRLVELAVQLERLRTLHAPARRPGYRW